MKGKQLKDLLQELHLLGYERDFSGTSLRDGLSNPRMDNSDFAFGDKDGSRNQGSEKVPWYQGISNFFGGITNIFNMVSGLFKGISTLPKAELFNQGYSWLNQFTGANLTGKEQQMNQFNAEQAAIQRGWQERMSNTSFQRQVADMQLAGINPAMSMGSNGASTPSGSAASGNASPAQAAAILEMILGAKKIQTEKEMNERSTSSAERIAEITAKSHIRAAEIAAEASMYGSDRGYLGKHEETEEQRRQFNELVEERKENLREQNNFLREQAKTEEERRNAYAKDALLNATKAKDIEIMRPYVIAYNEAKTDEAKWNAACAMVEAQFRNSLVSNGLVHYTMEHLRVEKNLDEFRSQMIEVANKRTQITDDGLHRGVWYLASLMNDLKSLYMIDPLEVLNLNVGSHVGGFR